MRKIIAGIAIVLAVDCAHRPTEAQTFSSPNEAAEALIRAASAKDLPALGKILGPDGKDLVASRDPVLDKNRAEEFAEQARDRHTVEIDPADATRATLVVGKEDWPLPIPIVKSGSAWHFDAKAGTEEILKRRIGENELDVITICRGYVEAQEQYASEVHDNSGVNQYAQRVVSTQGKHDGLAWRNPDGTWGGPVGQTAAKALEEGYVPQKPFHGYTFKLLKGQGAAARLGTLDYVVGGAMIGGFALVAWPAEYGVTGIQTFIVSYDGVVYQKDLGPESATIAAAMDRYNPDEGWKPTEDAP
jgi:hypothetical protein